MVKYLFQYAKEGWLAAEHKVDLHLVICCSQSTKKKGWLEAEHEVDLHTVILLFQVVKKKGWFETEHEEDLHLVTCLFKIGKKVWIENSRGADLQMVTYRSRTLSKYQFVLRKYWLGSCRATSSLSLSQHNRALATGSIPLVSKIWACINIFVVVAGFYRVTKFVNRPIVQLAEALAQKIIFALLGCMVLDELCCCHPYQFFADDGNPTNVQLYNSV